MTREDFWPLVTGETKSIREFTVQAYGWIGCVRTPEWNFSAVWNREAFEGNYAPQLYKREKDPDVVADLGKKLDDYIAAGDGLTRGSFHGRST